MATLVLTTIGTAVGGPVGGAIGALLGNQLDQRLFAAKRQGPRLGALTVQTSAYGQPIPKLFGTLRVAGTVIWATDLKEDRHRSGGGKGRPKTTTYSYSASFAVALSGRPVRAVHRIWADGKLLRGQSGDWKSETVFRLHLGDETQDVDPLLAATEAADGSPAYRGLAYAVFEDMQLADFGNRIPSLTFEVEADAAPVPIGQIAAELGGGAVADDTAATLGGYAAGGDSVRGAIEALTRAIPCTLRDDGTRLLLSDGAGDAAMLSADELGSEANGKRADRRAIDRQAAGTLPDEVTVTYYEPARDYQSGLQRARRGGPGRRVEAIELPAALNAQDAKAIAERRLATGWRERATANATLPWRRLDLRPGAIVRVEGRTWRVVRSMLEGMVVSLMLREITPASTTPPPAQPGRATLGSDLPHGPTRIVLLNLPPLDDGVSSPQLWLAAAGPSPGWRRATITASTDGGASWHDAGPTALPATMGQAATALAMGEPALFDDVSVVEIELLHDAMTLLSRTDDALAGGANLAMLGNELIQFGVAQRIAPARWRLSRLLRGRRGSEAEMAHHAVGEPFVMIDRDSIVPIVVAPDGIDSDLRVIVAGIADPLGVEAALRVGGRALRPPSPVHLRAEPLAGGGLRFAWTRRSRTGWSWTDGGEVPLGEEAEIYRLTVTPSTGAARTVEASIPTYDYGPDAIAAAGAGAAASFAITVQQLGAAGASTVAVASFNAQGDRV